MTAMAVVECLDIQYKYIHARDSECSSVYTYSTYMAEVAVVKCVHIQYIHARDNECSSVYTYSTYMAEVAVVDDATVRAEQEDRQVGEDATHHDDIVQAWR